MVKCPSFYFFEYRLLLLCCNQTKGYWMRNNQNRGWKWNGNLYNINKILASSMKKVTTASDDYLVYFHPLTIESNVFMRNGTYPLMIIGREHNNYEAKTTNFLKDSHNLMFLVWFLCFNGILTFVGYSFILVTRQWQYYSTHSWGRWDKVAHTL